MNGVKKLQREIVEKCRVFESNGEVMQAGWSKSPVFEYNKEDSKSSRHSERDCYYISNENVAMYLSVENLGLEFSIKIAVADLKRGGVICDCVVKKLNLIKNELPESGNRGEFYYSDKRVQLQMTNTMDSRILKCDFIDFGSLKPLNFNIILKKKVGESLNELAPFERNRKYFYFKRFVPRFVAGGFIKVGGIEYSLKEENTNAYFDWTRFFKPRKHNYQRLSADTMIRGKRFSLCLANRVGDNRYGNENCFFVDGKLEKLSQINTRSSSGRINRPYYFKAGYSAVDIIFKPYTVKGEAMCAKMDKTTVVFGILYGTIKRVGYDEPIVLDTAQAHLIFTEF